MPELPEVETTLRGIAPYLKSKIIKSINVREARLRWPVSKELSLACNLEVRDLTRRGKYIVVHTKNGSIIIHLGMSGSLRVVEKKPTLRKHDHVIFNLGANNHIVYHDPRRFGCILWTADLPQTHPLLSKLGPEPLDKTFDGNVLFTQSRKKTVAVKNFIMNSHVVVGVGNIYASEALFMSGIRPGRAAGRVSAAAYDELANNIKKVLSAAIKQGGTTLRDFVNSSGEPGYFQQTLNVYGREGEPCKVCAQTIKQKTIGQRSTFYCSRCQT